MADTKKFRGSTLYLKNYKISYFKFKINAFKKKFFLYQLLFFQNPKIILYPLPYRQMFLIICISNGLTYVRFKYFNSQYFRIASKYRRFMDSVAGRYCEND